jgi:hypothetical protein
MSGAGAAVAAGLRLAGFAALTAAAGHGLAILARGGPGAGNRLEAGFLRWTRIAFLCLGGAVAGSAWAGLDAGAGAGGPGARWGLLSWLVCFAVLHTHRVKAYKGARTAAAGVLGWALAALAWLATR